jgi:hypothetical protein
LLRFWKFSFLFQSFGGLPFLTRAETISEYLAIRLQGSWFVNYDC